MKNLREMILNTIIPENEIALYYLGQEGFIFKFRGKVILVDGYLTGPLYDPKLGWGRNYLSPLLPEETDFVDYVFCSHDHMDHTDPRTIAGILSVNSHAAFILPAAYADKVVSEYGVPKERIIPAHAGEELRLFDGFSVRPVPAAHEELHRDENGDYFEMGYVFNFDSVRVYHAGDCCVYEGQKELVGAVDIAMLPVNGRSYYRLHDDVIGNMTLEEAVTFARDAKAGLFIPMHFDLFPSNSIPAGYIPEAVKQYAPGLCYKIFQPGERLIYMK